MPPEIKFESPSGSLDLYRYPAYADEKLRAWDAADEYVLSHINEPGVVASTDGAKNILVVNDGFGAVSLSISQGLPSATITVISDSANSHSGIKANALANKIDLAKIKLESNLSFAESESEQPFDLVVIKVPKSLAQLEDNLRRVRAKIGPNTRVIAAGMVKNVHNSTLALFGKCIGTTTSSLAKKKARLIFAEVSANTSEVIAEPSKRFTVSAEISQTADDLILASCAGVFSHGSLDYGTQFLLETMQLFEPTLENQPLNILDLGCGTGALGIAAAKRFPNAKVTFVDESFAAIESTIQGVRLTKLDGDRCQYLATHCLDGVADASQDLILNNPPFHDAAARTSGIALEMFSEAKRALRIGGQLQVVANKHLGYRNPLKELFGNCKTMADNEKFVALSCIKKESP